MAVVRHDKNAVNKIFGTELPQESSGERDFDTGRSSEERDRYLRDNVPPHHH